MKTSASDNYKWSGLGTNLQLPHSLLYVTERVLTYKVWMVPDD